MKKTGLIKPVLSAITTCIAINSHAAIMINEVDYDQPGTDTAEFIELFNSGTSATSLDNYSIDLINGSTSSSYRSIDLTGYSVDANSYFVVCGGSPPQMAGCRMVRLMLLLCMKAAIFWIHYHTRASLFLSPRVMF